MQKHTVAKNLSKRSKNYFFLGEDIYCPLWSLWYTNRFTFDSGPPIQARTIQAKRFRPDDSGRTRFRPVTIQAGHDSGPS